MLHNFKIINGDTDSIMFCKDDLTEFSVEEQNKLLEEINNLLPSEITFKNDGIFQSILCLRTKNYAMINSKGETKIKGSALKSATLEPIFKQFLNELIHILLHDHENTIKLTSTYNKYVQMIDNITDIKPWAKKMTLSPVTFDSKRTNETNVIDAIEGKEYGPGDKIYVITCAKDVETGEYYKVGDKKGQAKTKKVKSLILLEDFKGDYDKDTYYDKLFKCVERFETVLPIKELFPKFTCKTIKNKV